MKMKISVCMDAYNGSRYINEQMRSILAQLNPGDELIVVDDASSDDTRTIVTALKKIDHRVTLICNDANQGVFYSFERALRLARGEIIFLSDQDDLWLEGKVQSMLEVFEKRRDVTLVASDARIIDGQGNVVSESFFRQRGRFRGGVLATLLKNKYLGCTLAFRRSMLDAILPFPKDIPMHDIWIGLVNAVYGKPYFIDRALIAYRRHGGNVSPARHRGVVQMVRWRWSLIRNLARLVGRRANVATSST